MDLLVSAIAQGVLWSSLSLGLFISFRILNIADLTTEGSYPLGAAVCVLCIRNGLSPIVSTLLAILAGCLAGAVTGLLVSVCRIPHLLAGILTMSALLSINLRILGSPNVNILNEQTLFDSVDLSFLPPHFRIIAIGGVMIVAIILIMYLFFKTEIGQSLIAVGDNAQMATTLGISTRHMTILGLVLSNGLVALGGAILAQYQGFADVNSGIGTIVVALAAIIIGEVIFGEVSFLIRLVCIVYGAIIYRLLLVGVLQLDFISPNDFKLVSALIIALFLAIPQIRGRKG